MSQDEAATVLGPVEVLPINGWSVLVWNERKHSMTPEKKPMWLESANSWFDGTATPKTFTTPVDGGPCTRPRQPGVAQSPAFNLENAVYNVCLQLAMRKVDPSKFEFDGWSEKVVYPGGPSAGGEVPGRVWDAHKLVVRFEGELYGIYDGEACSLSRKDADIAAVSLTEDTRVDGDVFAIYEGPEEG